MKDFRGREVLAGNTVVYALAGGLQVVTVVEADGDKVTVTKEDGKTKKLTWNDKKAVLIADVTQLA